MNPCPYLPVNIFLITNGRSPRGLSLPPSRLNPKPAPSLYTATTEGGPHAVSSAASFVSNPFTTKKKERHFR